MSFVRFSSNDFFQVMASTRRKFKRIVVKGAWEEVYEVVVNGTDKTTLRVFSSVDKTTNWSRDKGTDAIRVVAWDVKRGRNIDGETKTLRTTGWEERLKEKVEELYGRVMSHQCPECGSMLLEREGKHGKFLGCSGYPECKHIHGRKKKEEVVVKDSDLVEVVDTDTGEVSYEKKVPEAKSGIGVWLADKASTVLKAVSGKLCPKCGSDLVERTGKHGKFTGCSAYPQCEYTRKV